MQIDSLELEIQSTADEAAKSIDRLSKKLEGLQKSLGFTEKINFSGLSSITDGFGKMAHIDFSGLDKLTASIQQLGRKNALAGAGNLEELGNAISEFQQKVNNTNIDFDATPLEQLTSSVAKLGGKAAQTAIPRIKELTTALHSMADEMSHFPKINQDLIDMTNAMAKFARTGSSGGKAASELQKNLKGFSNSANVATISAKSLASAIGRVTAAFGAISGLVKLGKESISMASDLAEVQNVVDTAFGNYASKVEAFSKSSILNYGLSELQAKEIAGRFQAIGQAAGFSQGKMSDMSLQLTALAADMSSFYNVSAEDTARSLQAIFTGEAEPLRKYGMDLTNATLQQYALSQGIKKTVSEMSQQEKTLLRYNYVLASTESVQGDFQRTNESWSNQTRMLSQNFKELGSTIGEVFIHTLLPIVKKLNEIIQYTTAFAKAVKNSMAIAFGWEDDSSSAGIVLDDLSIGMDNFSDALSTASKNSKKLMASLRAFDELKVISKPDSDTGSNVDLSGLENSFSGIQNAATNLKDEVGSSFDEISNKAEAFQKKVEKVLKPIAIALAKVFGDTEIDYSLPEGSNAKVSDFIEKLGELGLPPGTKLKLNFSGVDVEVDEDQKNSFWDTVKKKLFPEEGFSLPEATGLGNGIANAVLNSTESGLQSGDIDPFAILREIFKKHEPVEGSSGTGFDVGATVLKNIESGINSGDMNPFSILKDIFKKHGNGTDAGESGGTGFDIGLTVFNNAKAGFESGSFDPMEALRQAFSKRKQGTTSGESTGAGFEVGIAAFNNTKSAYESQDFDPFGTLRKIFSKYEKTPEAAEIGMGVAAKILDDTAGELGSSKLEFSTEKLEEGLGAIGLQLGKHLGVNTKDGFGIRMNIVDISKITGVKSFKASAISKMGEIGLAFGNKMAAKTGTGFSDKKDDLKTKIENASNQAVNAAKKSNSLLDEFSKMGKALGDQISSGILSKKTEIQSAIQSAVSGSADIGFNISTNVINSYTSTLKSKKNAMEEFGARMKSAVSPIAETAKGVSGLVSGQFNEGGMEGIYPSVFSSVAGFSQGLELAAPPDFGISQKYGVENIGTFEYGGGGDLNKFEKALYNAVYQATASAMRNNGGSGNVTFEVKGDPEGLFRVTQKKSQEYWSRTGRNPFPV